MNEKKILLVALSIFLILSAASYASYRYAKERTGAVVLPGGITYLGPSPSPSSVSAANNSSTITVPVGTAWSVYQGKIFPYSFSYPNNLALGVFPNDPFDSVTIFWGNTNPQSNLLLRVENLNKISGAAKYVNEPKINYVQNWWRGYSFSGMGKITQFTNSQGLAGFRARFEGATFDDIFFEVPNRPELILWMSGKLLDQVTFDRIVESVAWK